MVLIWFVQTEKLKNKVFTEINSNRKEEEVELSEKEKLEQADIKERERRMNVITEGIREYHLYKGGSFCGLF